LRQLQKILPTRYAKLFHDYDENAHTGMAPVVEIVVVVDIVDVKVVVVAPIVGPGIGVFKPIAAVLKALVSAASTPAALHVKRVFAAEAASETVIGNATTAAGRLASRALAPLL